MIKLLRQLDKKCEEHVELLVLLLAVVLLRIPNFFEPYWYGDEAIYLTVGNGIRQGLKLYTDIIDHKTPLIYYLATVPDQFSFRLLNLAWMMATTSLFFFIAKKLFGNVRTAFISSLVFVLLTTLPWLEGNIPNGELFVLGFVLLGLWIMTKTALWQGFFSRDYKQALKSSGREIKLLLYSGVFFGLGLLTKVPALLDFGAALMIGWFSFTAVVAAGKTALKTKLISLKQFAMKSGWLLAGLLIPVIVSVLYFVALGSGQDYLDYGLLYNIRYSGSWRLEFMNPLLEFLFTLPGKILVMGGVIGLLSFARKYSPRFQFAAGWLMLALFAALLSNRPYPHYLIQAVPPFSLLFIELLLSLKQFARKKAMFATGGALLLLPFVIAALLSVRPYSVSDYYSKFYKLISGRMSMTEYDQSFNSLVKNNYQVADTIRGINGQRIFIWGTNPMLYALTGTTPTSRFTVSFHIKDFQDYEKTLVQIKKEKPKIIVVMNDETEPFPGLQQYLDVMYYSNDQYDTMTVYLLRENGR